MKKTISQRFFLSLCLMIVGCLWGSAAWAESITYSFSITPADFNGNSYDVNNKVHTTTAVCTTNRSKTMEVTWYSNQVMLKSGAMQWQAKKGYIYNKTDLGTIKSVTVTSSEGTFTTYYGTKQNPTSGTTVGGGFFKVKVGGATGKTSKVTVTFVVEENPELTTSTNSINFGSVETKGNAKNIFTISGTNLTPNSTVSLTIDDNTNFSVTPSEINVDAHGKIAAKNVTVTYAPTAVVDHSATLTISTSSGDLSREVSLSGTGIAPLTHYTVSWMVNGETYTEGTPSTDVAEGKKVETLPTNPAAIGSNVFMGWTTSAISGTSDDEPPVLFTTAEGAPAVTGNTTYYAVFAKLLSSTSSWNRVKTLAEITNGSYVIKNGVYVLPSTATSSAPKATAAPTITGDVITGNVVESITWYFTSTGKANQFYVKNSGGDYLYAKNDNNGIRVSSTSDKWTFSNNTAGYFSMQEANNSRYCGVYNSQDWRSYESATHTNYANRGKLELYKLVSEGTYTDYATTIATQPAANIHATTYYKKITSSVELADGGQYVIVYTEGEKGLLAGANNVHDATPATVVFEGNGTITTANAAAMTEITFEHNADANYYLSIGNSKYIKATNSLDLNVGTGKNNDALWTIGFDGNGNVEITSVFYDNRGILYSTAGSFKNYDVGNRGQASYPAIQLYQKVGEMPIAKATGYVSTYVADFAYVMPKHITGHTVTSAAQQGVISTTKVFRAGDEVPALTPLLIKSDEDYDAEENSRNYNPAVLNKTVDAYTGENMLEYRRTAENYTNTMKNESVYYYKLAIKNDKVGFYWGAADGAAFKMTKPSTAYLTVPQSISVQGFVLNLEEGETTGIATVVTNEDAPIYNLQGIRMNGKNLPKGIYIQGGKKFMVK